MNAIERAKNIITSPNKEWDAIALEQPNTSQIIMGYVLLLAAAAAVAAFIGYGLIGFNVGLGLRIAGIDWGIRQAVVVLIDALVGVFISALIIDALAPSFGSEKNMGRSVQLVAYSYTPAWIGGILSIYPAIGWLGSLAGGIYGLYLLYIGMPKLKKTPADKLVGYYVVSLVTLIVIFVVIGYIMARIMLSVMGLSYDYGTLHL